MSGLPRGVGGAFFHAALTRVAWIFASLDCLRLGGQVFSFAERQSLPERHVPVTVPQR